jgi:hypothetical protein
VGADLIDGNVMANDFAVHVLLANSPGDQLCVLRAEIEYQDTFVGGASTGI